MLLKIVKSRIGRLLIVVFIPTMCFLYSFKISFAKKPEYIQLQERVLKTLMPINENSSKIGKSMSNNKRGNSPQSHTFQQPLHIKRWYSNIILQNIASEFEFFAENLAKKLKVPGMAIALVTKDKILFKKTYGVRGLASSITSTSGSLSKKEKLNKNDFVKLKHMDSLASSITSRSGSLSKKEEFYSKQKTSNKINNNTIFRLGSVSKTLTSYLVYKLCNKKINNKTRFSINRNIIDFLSKDIYISNKHFTKKLNIKHILTHSCGTRRYCSEKIAYKDQSFEVLLENLKHARIHCNKPGAYFAYQNVIFSLIAPILESCFKEKYDRLFKLHVLNNLKLNNTTICEKEYSLAKNKALPHIVYLKSYKNILTGSYYDNILPAGGVSSSIDDIAKFIMHVLKDQEYIRFVESYTVNANSKIDKIEKYSYNEEAYDKIRSWRYGIGWYLENYNGNKVIFHGGRLTGFRAMVQFLPKYNVGFAIVTNSSSGTLCTILRHKLADLVCSSIPLSI